MTEENNQNPMYTTFLVLLIILCVVGYLMNPIYYYLTVVLNSSWVVIPKMVQLVDTYAFEMKNILLSSNEKYNDENDEDINKKVVDDKNELLAKLEALYRNFKYLRQLNQKSIYDTIVQFNLSTAGMLSIVCMLWGAKVNHKSQNCKSCSRNGLCSVYVELCFALFCRNYCSVRWEQIIRDHLSDHYLQNSLKLIVFVA